MSTKDDVNRYIAAAIVKACTEKNPRTIDAGAGPYQEASSRLTRDESKEICLEATHKPDGAIEFRYGYWVGDKNVAFAGWNHLPDDYSHICKAHLLPNQTERTVTVLYKELLPYLPT